MPARLKLNYFTPLPPEQTAIAEFSMGVLPSLAEIADVTVWTYQETWTPIEGVKVHRFDAATDPARINAADMTFFNMGNNFAYHGHIYDLMRRIPGVVILHDPNLQYFFHSMAKASAVGRRHYLSAMARHYGAAGAATATRLLADQVSVEDVLLHYLMRDAVLDGSLAVVTHNRSVRAELERSTGLPSFYLPLAYESRRRDTAPKARHGPPCRLISFGYMGPHRRHDAIARAIASLPQRDQFTWDLYGQYDPTSIPVRWRNHLGRALTEHGFVENDALDDAVAKADLAINLRNPTMGEASSTQLKIWDNGLSSLVSRTGWYADQPADTLFFVEPGREFEDVTRHLQAFLADPAPFYEAGRRGQAYVDRAHNPRQYTQGLVDIAREAAAIRRRHGAMDLARRAADHLLTLGPSEAVASMSSRLAHHIDDLLGERSADP